MTARLSAPSDLHPIILTAGERTRSLAWEFFTSGIRNQNTRDAYARAVHDFCVWLEARSLSSIVDLQTSLVVAFAKELANNVSPSTVRQRLTGIRAFLGSLVAGGILAFNPAVAVRGPGRGDESEEQALSPEQIQRLFASFRPETLAVDDIARQFATPVQAELRDRALIAVIVYTFARISVVLSLKVSDVFDERHRLWIRFRRNDGKQHQVLCHPALARYLRAYLEHTGLRETPDSFLFPVILFRYKHGPEFGKTPVTRESAYAMIRKHARAAGILIKVGNQMLRASGITIYLSNGGNLKNAATMASHTSLRTTQLYRHRAKRARLDKAS